MKKLCIALVASLFLLASCGKKSEGTHTHEDGVEHADHAATEQEEFDAADSAQHEHDSTEHRHDSTDHKHPN